MLEQIVVSVPCTTLTNINPYQVRHNSHRNKKYEYLYSVESIRIENGSIQDFILNLGKLDIDPSLYKTLARII